MIGTILKLMLTRGTSIKRWNNFPRIEYISHLDNVGFVIHIALFLAQIEEKEKNVSIDKEFIIKRILFHSLIVLVLSDINAGTKDYIKTINPLIFSKVEKKALEKILELEGNESIKNDILSTLKEKEKILEVEIIEAARKYSGLLECSVNHKIFSEVYEVPMNQINASLEKIKKKVKSLDILLKNENYKKYLFNIKRLSHITRWNGKVKFLPISVMSHLVIVCFISYVIAHIEADNNNPLSSLDLMLRGLYHDIPEAITGDIIAPTKRSVKGFSEILEEVEKNMLDDYLFSYIEKDYKKFIAPYLFHPFEGEIGKIVKYADILSALFEAKIEILSGNIREFEDISVHMHKKLVSTKLAGIDYLVNNALIEFSEKHKFD
ncbi:HD domain-containing protein [Candidatus Gracilibacteria bacterium]|nr:HD domain-containing protein [Candidatus Gracilibacteria bacterium]NUJ98444.1 HD domain-containing protein [Candidatus Gracilibacteria bacterium]